eukprot:TRINITY_DN2956_c0_g1_i2.p1 TRINITY_DN2956_c0_g1~~TRINITY_DN2956_c0_g1_i2.p1  ORF type:complete len:696 (-),score=156.52 TRINITY_DN2956_c0_g1_i2:278-2365(-)
MSTPKPTPKDDRVRVLPFASGIDVSFWQKLTKLKLDKLQLSSDPVPLVAHYTAMHHPGRAASFDIGSSSLDFTYKQESMKDLASEENLLLARKQFKSSPHALTSPGKLHNVNTKEEFKALDKMALANSLGQQIWDDIRSGRAVEDPSLLTRFELLTFADIKKWHFMYWMCTPALVLPEPLKHMEPEQPLQARYDPGKVHAAYDHLRASAGHPIPFFFLHIKDDTITAHPLSQWSTVASAGAGGDCVLGFADPTPGTHGTAVAGWPILNFMVLAAVQFKLTSAHVVCLRQGGDKDASVICHIKGPEVDANAQQWKGNTIGWEVNVKGKMGPRLVDLSRLMDSKNLAETSVDLNLKLMRWRLMPELDVQRVAQTKVLLIGAGTLGCNVARCLLGWGVRHMTFVDNGAVSFSNPVRQSLFTYEDCLKGGRPKAAAAAEAVKAIFPSVVSEGHVIHIPMPGHHVSDGEKEMIEGNINKLSSLIASHDVTFLLTDTRESRWLPSLLARAHGKPLYNAAMGFDTFVVMRHGLHTEQAGSSAQGQLGCYFCNDVVAPTDSLTNRSLDQQCTVTRPGLSMMTSSLLVELMVACLHHPAGHAAPATVQGGERDSSGSPLGLLPHQIRGSVATFDNTLIVGHAYEKCTACSSVVVNEYQNRGFEFLLQVFNTPSYLEDLTGLAAMKQEADNVDWDVDSDASGDDW